MVSFSQAHPPINSDFRMNGILSAGYVTVTTIRQDGSRQVFNYADSRLAGFLETTSEIPEPHGFKSSRCSAI